jgi:hypothetical protein
MINSNCQDSNPDCEIIPLEVGNSWTYEIISYDTTGNETGRDTSINIVDEMRTFNSELWYHIDHRWYTNRNDGIFHLEFFNVSPQEMYLKYPASLGDQFFCDTLYCPFYKEVTSIDTIIINNLGGFYCYGYKTVYDYGTLYFDYVAPGIGVIRRTSHYPANDSTYYMLSVKNLIQYSLE